MRLLIILFSCIIVSHSVHAKDVCVIYINAKFDKITNVNICNKNDFLDVTIWYPYYEDKNFPIRLITNFCDYNKSIVLDTANLKPRNIVSLTCVKRNWVNI